MKINRFLISGFLAFALLIGFGWYIFTFVLHEVIQKTEINPVTLNIIFFLISLVLALTLAIFISRLLSKPIEKLSKNIEDITKGKFDIQFAKSNIDEVQSLTESLNRILVSLKLAILKTGVTKAELGFGEAIEAMKKAEKEKKEAKERYKSLFEGAVDAIFIADAKTRKLVDVNKAAENLTGYSKKELINMKADQLHPKDMVKETMEKFKQQAAGKLIIVETEVLTKSGKRVPVAINSALIKIKEKDCLQGIFRNISERKKKEEELERFAKLSVGREEKMIELKRRIKELEKKVGKGKANKEKKPVIKKAGRKKHFLKK